MHGGHTLKETLMKTDKSDTWIIQANPNHYALDSALRLLEGPLVWTLNQHARSVQAGDTAYLWRASGRAGREAGIVARARIGTDVSPDTPPNDLVFHQTEFSESRARQVALEHVTYLPAAAVVSRAQLRDDARAADLLIMRVANQTVFPVSEDTSTRLAELFDATLQHWSPAPGVVPPFVIPTDAEQAIAATRERALMSPEWWERTEDRIQKRVQFRTEELTELGQFFAQEIGLTDYRNGFNQRTTGEHGFGFGGTTGAMVLNQIDKHTDPARSDALMRDVLRVPETEDEARQRSERLVTFMASEAERQGLSGKSLASGRATTLLSFFWHLQAPTAWPAWYPTVRDQFEEWGLTTESKLRDAAGYLEFCAAFEAVRERWNEHPWFVSRIISDKPDADEKPNTTVTSQNIWLYAPGRNAEYWEAFREEGIAAIGWDEMGDHRTYDSLDGLRDRMREVYQLTHRPSHNSRACWDFANTIAIGDIIYAKAGRHSVIGRGIVTSDATFDENRPWYRNVRKVDWTWSGRERVREKSLVLKTLTCVSDYPQLVASLANATCADDPEIIDVEVGSVTPTSAPYSVDDAVADLFVTRETFEEMLELLRHKKNLVLQGPPGTGKTFIAERLAWALMEERAGARVARVQFHQTMSYEDFVQGFRPDSGDEAGFRLNNGPFMRLCDAALQSPDDDFVLVIDEINRGNLSRIFGELLMLLEADKRDPRWGLTLMYAKDSDEPFHVPPNVYVIGTMNTADRSLAIVDYALRRRFAFVDLMPAFSGHRLVQHLADRVGKTTASRWCKKFERLNQVIEDDPSLGRGFHVGHSYLCGAPKGDDGVDIDGWFGRVIRFEIQPLLEEYWFDDRDRAAAEVALLHAEDS